MEHSDDLWPDIVGYVYQLVNNSDKLERIFVSYEAARYAQSIWGGEVKAIVLWDYKAKEEKVVARG